MFDRFSVHNSMIMRSAMADRHGYLPLGSG
jgi:hypothetical protein